MQTVPPVEVTAAAVLGDALTVSAQATALCERIRAAVFPHLPPLAVVLLPYVIGPYCRCAGFYMHEGENGRPVVHLLARYHDMQSAGGRFRVALTLLHELCSHHQMTVGRWHESGKSTRRGTHRNAEWRAAVRAACEALAPGAIPADATSGKKIAEAGLCHFPRGSQWRPVRDALRVFVA